MKILKYILLLTWSLFIMSCTDLDIPPKNIVQDDAIFGNDAGLTSYMANLYSQLPMEDFRYSPNFVFNSQAAWTVVPRSGFTGESISRDARGAASESADNAHAYWEEAYILIRESTYLIENFSKYEDNFSVEEGDRFLGEARFIRAWAYFALVQRYGGVPLITEILSFPEQSLEELQRPRASEEVVYDFIAEELDKAIDLLPENNQIGRANKFVAAALKSRAMLFAGSIAEFNETSFFDNDNNQLCGIPQSRAEDYFRQSYEASLMLEGHYSLYKNEWAPNDKDAQYQNFLNLFHGDDSPETIFIKDYQFPESAHGYDAYYVPLQLIGPNGYSSGISPSLDFVEMFDGLPKNAEGKIEVFDENGFYKLFEDPLELFADAEPRLRATVVFPGDEFKGVKIEIRRGIYKNENTAGGIAPLIPYGFSERYEVALGDDLVSSATQRQTAVILANGERMNPAGLSGIFYDDVGGALSGFAYRKLLDPDLPVSQTLERRLDHKWIEMRYAEVLLNRAEAAYELHLAGANDVDYAMDAYQIINEIRERAGADLLSNVGEISRNIVRKERRKELAFENKTWWDLKRWRIFHEEQNSRVYRSLYPFYVEAEDKYLFDARENEMYWIFTFDTRWYYQQIPSKAINPNPNILQNPGY